MSIRTYIMIKCADGAAIATPPSNATQMPADKMPWSANNQTQYSPQIFPDNYHMSGVSGNGTDGYGLWNNASNSITYDNGATLSRGNLVYQSETDPDYKLYEYKWSNRPDRPQLAVMVHPNVNFAFNNLPQVVALKRRALEACRDIPIGPEIGPQGAPTVGGLMDFTDRTAKEVGKAVTAPVTAARQRAFKREEMQRKEQLNQSQQAVDAAYGGPTYYGNPNVTVGGAFQGW